MSGIIDNLTSAINTWNSKLAEIWLLLTESPETFKGGDIWQIIVKNTWSTSSNWISTSCAILCLGID